MPHRCLGLLLGSFLFASAARGQAADSDSIALAVAVFRTAIVHGQLTAHGGAVPEVVCLATSTTGGPGSGGFIEPDSIVVARIRERTPNARPMSACRIEPLQSAPRNTSLVVEPATGKRGIVVWMQPPARDATGARRVNIGYYEAGLSAAIWNCAVRRIDNEWVVNACRLLGIS